MQVDKQRDGDAMYRIIRLTAAMLLFSPAFAQAEELLGATKSLSITEQGPDALWKPDEIEEPASETGELKSLMPDTAPSIQEKRLTTAKGVVILSQLWDITCAELCLTKVVLVQPDGNKKVLLEDMLPQVLPEETSKSLQTDDQVTISDDLKTLSIKTDNGVQNFDLSN